MPGVPGANESGDTDTALAAILASSPGAARMYQALRTRRADAPPQGFTRTTSDDIAE
jgi:hypothetical protein